MLVCPLSPFSQDVFYHFIALLFYFAAFVLEAATTAANGGAHIKPLVNSTEAVLCITYPRGNIFTVLDDRQYSINVAATVSILCVCVCVCVCACVRACVRVCVCVYIYIYVIFLLSKKKTENKNKKQSDICLLSP